MLILGGATGDDGWRGELLSYEAPTYFGMLTAGYTPDHVTRSKSGQAFG